MNLYCKVIISAIVSVSPIIVFPQVKDICNAMANEPIHAVVNEKLPYWNKQSVQFLYPPVFDVKPSVKAVSYRYKITEQKTNKYVLFEDQKPNTSLAQVWEEIPVGKNRLVIEALDNGGNVVDTVYNRLFHRAAPFSHVSEESKIPLEESFKMGLNALVHSPELSCWFSETGVPDSSFIMYRYPSKMVGAAASALAVYAGQMPKNNDAEQALKASERAADYLISLNFSENDKWANHPRTYHPTMFQQMLKKHKMHPDNYMTSYGGLVGGYLLDVYDVTKKERFLDAAIAIADTYCKMQQPNGTWKLFVNGKNGEQLAKNDLIPTVVIQFLRRLHGITKDRKLIMASNKALRWIMKNPVKTWNWQGQFEDVRPMPLYKNLTQHEACDLAIYLLTYYPEKEDMVDLATELIRFSEDQFVVWDSPTTLNPAKQNEDGNQAKTSRWITPCVLEQYRCYAPVSASSAKMIKAFISLYKVTKDDCLLLKAKALAVPMVNLQQTAHAAGRYETWIQKRPGHRWLNCEVYTINAIQELVNLK